ncbi:MAG TPA: hypothetical protein VKU93_02055 [Terracidiphilus sp.]|nr:hypothetical protein [Terracidiphilus sp.]
MEKTSVGFVNVFGPHTSWAPQLRDTVVLVARPGKIPAQLFADGALAQPVQGSG